MLLLTIGFYDDHENNVFGTMKKDKQGCQQRPLSNFTFKFVKKIVSSHSSSTGFLVEVIPEVVVCGESDAEDVITSRYSYRCLYTVWDYWH